LVPPPDRCNDLIGVCFPDEWLWLAVVLLDEAVDGCLQINDGMENAVLQPSARQFCEETFDGVQP
jgi:hypothetical protein